MRPPGSTGGENVNASCRKQPNFKGGGMAIIKSRVNTESKELKENYAYNKQLVEILREQLLHQPNHIILS